MPKTLSKEDAIKFLASGFGLGYSPVAPGTMGTLGGLFLYLLLPANMLWVHAGVIVLLFFCGVWAATRVEQFLKEKDAQIIVLDEVVGFLIAVFFLPRDSWLILPAGFVLFRLFDIFKPFPLQRLERIPKGWGVMLDDVGAGTYTNLILRVMLVVFSRVSLG